MKKLLKVSLLIICVTFFFSACSDDDEEDDFAIEFATLPVKAKDFVNTHFSNFTVNFTKERYVAEANGTFYSTYLTGGFEIDFTKTGEWTSIESDINAVPESIFTTQIELTAIKKYVLEKYPDLKILELEKKTGGFKVELSNNLDLLFDSNGDFIRID